MDRIKTAVIYLRVSSQSQLYNTSFERQYEHCKAWCDDHNVRIIGVLTDCCSASSGEHIRRGKGKRYKKVHLGNILDKLESGFKTDYLVFEEWDRFSRLGYYDTQSLKADFNNYNVEPKCAGLGYTDKITMWGKQEKFMFDNLGYHEM